MTISAFISSVRESIIGLRSKFGSKPEVSDAEKTHEQESIHAGDLDPVKVSDYNGTDTEDSTSLTELEAKQKNNKAKLLHILVTLILLLLLLGGAGTLTGWLMINGPQTIADREQLRPKLTVEILAPDQNAPENSSRIDIGTPSSTTKLETTQSEATKPTSPIDPMAEIVNANLIEQTENGPLPIVSSDGRSSWIEYARTFDKTDRRPRLAIIITNLGLSSASTEATLDLLPPEATLSFSPLTKNLLDWVRQARLKGHEVLIDLPMEPIGFPQSDPGQNTLLTSESEVENLNRLENVMKKSAGYVGLLGSFGSRFTNHAESLLPILQILKVRGLLYVDSGASSRSLGPELASSIQLPRAFNNRFIDRTPSRQAIDNRLIELEEIVKLNRFAIGIAQPYPISLDRISAWIPTLENKGITLAPITAIADKQSLR